ncbi:YlmC/YmxH family sporulation protein [Halobacillus litoralis]|uniref:YlmC/YmxH family sporulation protein n=1 Tax=Halobacillus litoralis TaxID=45668 RepID=UPI001CD4D029|nr:YlmC/YmxH family sporulation protein [Halobacillus litoralis]MCA0969089.1 YlmC/YmxH family sporulation protein [Halobacillus litoralis]
MRLTSLSHKEVVDIHSGEKLGVLGKADLVIDPESGAILSLVIMNQSLFGRGNAKQSFSVSWEQIETIGEDIILLNQRKEVHDH